ncbi:MAG: hypothetical protein ABWY25_09540 [Paenisporosarcina sp.]
MSTRRSHDTRRQHRPAVTPEGRENQLISLAADLAERQLIEGTASSQVVVHFLKLASTREKLEQERLQRENLLLSARVDQIASSKRIEELYETALNAMRQYAGRNIETYDDDED